MPESKQTCLFSATLPSILADFSRARLHEPELIRLDLESKLSEALEKAGVRRRCQDAQRLRRGEPQAGVVAHARPLGVQRGLVARWRKPGVRRLCQDAQRLRRGGPVSYTHLTLPTICSV
eukprot:1900322-Prymnesium_polylepis.2